MPDWRAAADAIAAEFADPEQLAYMSAVVGLRTIPAIRHEQDAEPFGEGRTARRIRYEIQQSALPLKPTNQDTFVHRGTLWKVANVTTLDEVFAWDVDVTNGGPA